jgi:Tol biopolymer transport system component
MLNVRRPLLWSTLSLALGAPAAAQHTRVSVSTAGVEANGSSLLPTVSATGRFVAFVSEATNLVAGDTNGVADVFLRDLVSGTTQRLNTTPAGVESTVGYPGVHRGSVSGDGSVTVFDTYAPLLGPATYRTNVYVRRS